MGRSEELISHRLDRLPDPVVVNGAIGAQALALLEAGRVRVVSPDTAWVAGRSGWYRVRCHASGVICTCEAKVEICSHAAAALVLLHEAGEARRNPPEPEPATWTEEDWSR
jgi:L-alanine-DL-glutamate epimerase-like enolase superfamily enzyme